MDHERIEKELEAIFEEIQRSYTNFVDDVFTLQERTLGFALELLESPAGREASNRRAALEELADKSRGERKRFETLASKADEAYLMVLKGPVDEHHHKTEQAEPGGSEGRELLLTISGKERCSVPPQSFASTPSRPVASAGCVTSTPRRNVRPKAAIAAPSRADAPEAPGAAVS
jgi:hypothetical protein